MEIERKTHTHACQTLEHELINGASEIVIECTSDPYTDANDASLFMPEAVAKRKKRQGKRTRRERD